MSNPIQNATQLNVNTNLSSYDIKEGELHQIGSLHQTARNIADNFRNITSGGRLHIASRNAAVAMKMNALIQKTAPGGEAAQAEALDKVTVARHNLRGMIALKEKVNSSNFQSETRDNILTYLNNLNGILQTPYDVQDAYRHSKLLASAEKYIFSNVDTSYDTKVHDFFTNHVSEEYKNLNDLDKVYKLFAKDMFRDGIDSFIGRTIPRGGIDAVIESKGLERNLAMKFRNEYDETLSPEEHGKKMENDATQIEFFKQLLKEAMYGNAPKGSTESTETFSDRNFEIYGPLIASLVCQEGITAFATEHLHTAVGLWDPLSMIDSGMAPSGAKTHTDISSSDKGYTVIVRGRMNYISTAANTSIGTNTYEARVFIPHGQRPTEEQALPFYPNPDGKEIFVPKMEARFSFKHSVE